MRETLTMKALKEGLKSCSGLPAGKIRIMKWWITAKILPYIHAHYNPFTVGEICRYFGIHLNRYMFYRWHMACGMDRQKALKYKSA